MPKEEEPTIEKDDSPEDESDLLFERYSNEVEVAKLLEEGDVEEVQNIDDVISGLKQHSNDVLVAQFEHQTTGFRVKFAGQNIEGIFKPASGERLEREKRRWGIDYFYKREAAAYTIDRALGIGLVPPTVVREVEIDGEIEVGAMRLFIPSEEAEVWYLNSYCEEHIKRFTETPDWEAIAVFDYVIANPDRKLENILFSTGEPRQLYPIDNGYSLSNGLINPVDAIPKGPRAKLAFNRTESGELVKSETQIPEELHKIFVQFSESEDRKNALIGELEEIGIGADEIEGAIERIELLAETGTYQ